MQDGNLIVTTVSCNYALLGRYRLHVLAAVEIYLGLCCAFLDPDVWVQMVSVWCALRCSKEQAAKAVLSASIVLSGVTTCCCTSKISASKIQKMRHACVGTSLLLSRHT